MLEGILCHRALWGFRVSLALCTAGLYLQKCSNPFFLTLFPSYPSESAPPNNLNDPWCRSGALHPPRSSRT